MVITSENKFINGIRIILESVWLMPVMFCYGFLCWFFEASFVTVIGFTTVIALILLFCDKINNVYALIFFVGFFITDIQGIDWTVYVVCACVASACLAGYTIKLFFEKKGSLKKGKMFYALLIADVAFLLGGAIGRFNLTQFGIVLGLSAAVMLLYFLAVNCTGDFSRYLAKVFIIGALFISVQIMCVKIADGDLFGSTLMGKVFFFSAHSLNTAAIFLLLGITGCFSLGVKKKSDWLFFSLALFLMFALFLSCCRTVLAISIPVILVTFILFIVYSPKKLNFLWLTLVLVAAGAVTALCFKEQIAEFIEMIFDKFDRGLNGRESLWPWCWEKFLEEPVFGYGFITDEYPPTVRAKLVLAHNTALQWLVSLGVIGASLMSFFYIAKYKTLFKNFTVDRVFALLALTGVELSGIMDQAAAMDIFVYLVSLALICGVENESKGALAEPAVQYGETV